MSQAPDHGTPADDPDLEAALRDPAFDDVPVDAADDPARPEDIAGASDAPHLSLDEEQVDAPGDDRSG